MLAAVVSARPEITVPEASKDPLNGWLSLVYEEPDLVPAPIGVHSRPARSTLALSLIVAPLNELPSLTSLARPASCSALESAYSVLGSAAEYQVVSTEPSQVSTAPAGASEAETGADSVAVGLAKAGAAPVSVSVSAQTGGHSRPCPQFARHKVSHLPWRETIAKARSILRVPTVAWRSPTQFGSWSFLSVSAQSREKLIRPSSKTMQMRAASSRVASSRSGRNSSSRPRLPPGCSEPQHAANTPWRKPGAARRPFVHICNWNAVT